MLGGGDSGQFRWRNLFRWRFFSRFNPPKLHPVIFYTLLENDFFYANIMFTWKNYLLLVWPPIDRLFLPLFFKRERERKRKRNSPLVRRDADHAIFGWIRTIQSAPANTSLMGDKKLNLPSSSNKWWNFFEYRID